MDTIAEAWANATDAQRKRTQVVYETQGKAVQESDGNAIKKCK
jgi:hypothetical protein